MTPLHGSTMRLCQVLVLFCVGTSIVLGYADDPCPFGCRCQQQQQSKLQQQRRNKMQNIYISHYLHKYFHYKRHDLASDYPSNAPAPGRKMVCLGLQQMPYNIPNDISKLHIYGGRRALKKLKSTTSFTSRPPSLLRIGIPQPRPESLLKTVSVQSDDPNILSSYQLTSLSKDSFKHSQNLFTLTLTGNRIKIIHAGQFNMLRRLKKLNLKKNRIKLVSMASFRGLDSLKKLDLSYNQIDQIDRTIFNDVPNLSQLLLRNNKLRTLHRESLNKLDRLKVLDVSNNNIEDLPDDLFGRTQRLEELVLSSNEISVVRPYWFFRLKRLKILDLSKNHISILKPGLLSPTPELQQLDLSRNMLSEIQRHLLANTRKLKSLRLSGNRISAVDPNTFVDLARLEDLYMDNNRLSKLEKRSFAGVRVLRTLNLASNKLRRISNNVWGNMEKLRLLNLSDNNIDVVRRHTFKGLIELRDLHLDNNRIRHLEEEAFAVSLMSHFSKISWIGLQHNQIRYLRNRAFYGMPHVKFLNLGDNRVYRIEIDTFKYTINLRSLILDRNNLQKIQPGQFENLNLLTHINLKSNFIRDIVPRTFYGMYSTEEINISDNNLTLVIPGSFIHMPHLGRVDFSKNNLSAADMDWFRHNHQLRSLNLTANRIKRVDTGRKSKYVLNYLGLARNKLNDLNGTITRTLGELSIVDLHDNPWICDCRLAWLSNDAKAGIFRFIDLEKTTCKFPLNFAGKQISRLKTDDFSCSVKAVDEDENRRYSFSCKTSNLPTTSRSRSSISDMEDWHATILDSRGAPICGGVQLERNWLLTHASCWLNKSVSSVQITRGEILAITGNSATGGSSVRSSKSRIVSAIFFHPKLSVRRNEEYASIVLVKLLKQADTGRVANQYPAKTFPCVGPATRDNGHRMYLTGRANFIQVRKRVEVYTMSIKGTTAKNDPVCKHESFFCVRWNSRRFRPDVYDTNGAPIYDKNGLSLVGIRAEQFGSRNRPFVEVLYYLPWIESSISNHE